MPAASYPNFAGKHAGEALFTAADFTAYLSGLAEVPILTWRDVSHRTGVLVTTPDAFATQLAVLRHEGYQSIGLGTLEAVAGRAELHFGPRAGLSLGKDAVTLHAI